MRKLTFWLFIVAFSVSIFSLASAEEPQKGGTLYRSSISDPKSFNTYVAQETSTTNITDGNMFEGLTAANGVTTEIEPNLATSWDVSEDGLTWIFYLREDVKWSDGESLTADDVVFTFNDVIYNPEVETDSRDIFTIAGKQIEVSKVDDYTVKFVLPEPFCPFIRSMVTPIVPKHILGGAIKEGTFNATWGVDTPLKDIVCSGPFVLTEYKPSQWVRQARNPNYWRKGPNGEQLPYLDEMIWKIVPDLNAAVLEFQTGGIDVLGPRPEDWAILLPEQEEGDFTLLDGGPTFGTSFLTLNWNAKDPLKKKWFTNKTFRKAVAHCIDKGTIIDNILLGLGVAQWSPVSEAAKFFYNPNVIRYEYDLDKTKGMLLEAGFEYEGDVLYDAEGNKVTFSMTTNAGNTTREQIGNIIKDDLAKVGIEAIFQPIQFNDLVTRLTETGEWEAVIIGLTGGPDPYSGKNVEMSNGGLHFWNYEDEPPEYEWEGRVDEIFISADSVPGCVQSKRKELYDEWQVIISDELPVIYTVQQSALFAIRNKLQNVKPTAFGGVDHNIWEIWIKQ